MSTEPAATQPKAVDVKAPTLDYLRAAQDLLRAMLQQSRKKRALDATSDSSLAEISEISRPSLLMSQREQRAFSLALESVEKAGKDYLTAKTDVLQAIDKLRAAHAVLARQTSDPEPLPQALLDKMIAMNKPTADPGQKAR